ncbi:peroxiredoxin [Allokutzneria sp. NRRL B-24872]|uniref:peroxiredoxin n=1 Tax=Allokutzneria sp. NRRL B-24872 TaxID=1137961 RepID=UPI000A37647E|nr:peroxiredoxin [Allokutzneria sp. NRRL B-24872]
MRPGDTIADFTLPDQDGEPRTLSKLLTDGPVVLFFYPAAMTGGCTAEACHFRDLGAEFAELGAQRVGISGDAVSKQKEFASQNTFDYPLLSDVDGTVSAQFGVKRRIIKMVKRHTFVIGTDRVLLDVIKSELRFEAHADQALESLRKHVKG